MHVDERGATAARYQLFARHGEKTQSSTADKFKQSQVKDQVVDSLRESLCHFAVKFRRRGRVETADEFYRDHTRPLGVGALLNFQWHIFLGFVVSSNSMVVGLLENRSELHQWQSENVL